MALQDGYEDRGPQMIAIYWVEAAIAIVVVSLRVWGRITIRQVGLDDYVMIFTLVLFLILACFSTYYATIGGLRHLFDLTKEQQAQVVRINWITQPWVIFGFATGKISVALLILRFIGPNTFWRKWMLYFSMVSVFVLNTIDCIITFTQCNPPRALWETDLVKSGEAKCWNPHAQANYAIFLAAWNVMIDVVLAVLPVTIFYHLNLSFKKKLGLSALLGLGLVAAICGAVKTKYLASLSARSDLTWETFNLFTWSGAELFVIIVCGSIPPIKPLYDMVFRKNRLIRSGYDWSNSNSTPSYAIDNTLKNSSNPHPLESADRHLMCSSDEEVGLANPAVVEMKMRVQSGGIIKATEIRVTHAPRI